MKTDELVTMLSTNVEPVDRKLVARTVGIAVAAGAAVAVGTMLAGFGVRADLTTARAFLFLALKLAFAIAIVGIASVYLTRLTRPGGERRISVVAIAIPFAAIGLLAMASLSLAPASHWNRMVTGDQWLECLLSIPVIAIVPFATIIFAVEGPPRPISSVPVPSRACWPRASARWPTRCTAPTTQPRSSPSGTSARSFSAPSQVPHSALDCCVGNCTLSRVHVGVSL